MTSPPTALADYRMGVATSPSTNAPAGCRISDRLRVEAFILAFIAANTDERGEISARACIDAAEAAGIPEKAVTKARFINRDRIGSRKAGRRDGWVWYPLTDLYQDSTRTESSSCGFGVWHEPIPADWFSDDDLVAGW